MKMIDMMLDGRGWVAVDPPKNGGGGLPYVTHEGTVVLDGFNLRAYQLSDGNRVIDADDLEDFFAVAIGAPEESKG